MRMKRSASLADLLVAGGFVRPHVLWRGLQLGRPDWACWPKILLLSLSGVIVGPFAWLQSLLWGSQLRQLSLPPDPIVVIGHWRSGTTYLHQLLACDPTMATARNSLTVAPQVALLFRLPIRLILGIGMTSVRPIDAVPWGIDDPKRMSSEWPASASIQIWQEWLSLDVIPSISGAASFPAAVVLNDSGSISPG